jgi:SAM-dependent methyltransferase
MGLGRAFAPYYASYKASRIAQFAKRRRYQKVISALGIAPPARILDVGCGTGADFTRFAVDDGYECHGLDISHQEHLRPFTFTLGTATSLPYPDGHFDAAVSIGVFEHIQPIEDLCLAATEIARVAKSFCVLVPSSGTLIEPHTLSVLWQIRAHGRKAAIDYALNFFSDEAWLQFKGFRGARLSRFWYLPGIQNLMIYGGQSTA